jgi:protein-tyrosine phosphatase
LPSICFRVVATHHLAVGGLDNDTYDMLGHPWGACMAFLKGVIPTNGCAAGVNRSGLIAGAALLVLEGMDLLDVVRLLKAKPGTVLTDPSCQCQLYMLAAQHHRLGPKPEEFTDTDE